MKNLSVDILDQFPKEDEKDYRSLNRQVFNDSNKTCIVIDDDPTGNQTVYGIPLLTEWSEETIFQEFEKLTPVFFLLTNSRSLETEESTSIYSEIITNIEKASERAKRNFTVISRSDSTLRGHFPSEIEAIRQNGNFQEAITVFIPVMFEGGRVTINDIHYLKEGNDLIPVNETAFAKDHYFAYSKANLKEWIAEKTEGKVAPENIFSFSIRAVRTNNVNQICALIHAIPPAKYCVFNALNYKDLDKISNALLLAENLGTKIVYRTSSSFIPSYIGLLPQSILKTDQLCDKENKNGGLTIVGSYVSKSSKQLNTALVEFDKEAIFELDVKTILSENSDVYLDNVQQEIEIQLTQGKDVLVFTSRKLVTGSTIKENVAIGAKVSASLIYLVKGLKIRPNYILAKGGITSHDLAIKGLDMKRSVVLGQVLPGIPVWQMGGETKFPNLTYIVFPGNVGNENSLATIIQKLKTT